MRIINIDAIRSRDGGWEWNDWRYVNSVEFPKELLKKTNRSVLKWFRDNNLLSEFSGGKISVEDDDVNIVIKQKSNGRPLWAIELERT